MAQRVSEADTNELFLGDVRPSPFPAPSQQTSGPVGGVKTDVTVVNFADKIVITISQGGRLSQWVQVPLSSASPTTFETVLSSSTDDMLPLSHLTPKTLLGAGSDQRETVGHLYAAQIASSISKKNPEEVRTVLVGLGLLNIDLARETFFDMMELLQAII